MRVLLDECFPRKLGKHLEGMEWSTVQREGWGGLKNGELLAAIQGKWDVLLTNDTNMPWQQVISRRDICLIIVRAFSNDAEGLSRRMPDVLRALTEAVKGTVVQAGDPAVLKGSG